MCVPRTPRGGLSDTSALEISSGGGSGLNSLPVQIRTGVRTLRSPALNHRILLSKLLSFNFSPHTLRWIESYLSGHTQYVSIQNYNSAPLSISTGVPQGSVLGPLLFTLYINDLPSVCPNTNIQMYADDSVIYIHGSSVSQVANELTEFLVHVAAWLEQCCLQLNISKTVCMFITKTKNLSVVPDVFVSGERLQVVSEYKYLGVLIDSKL